MKTLLRTEFTPNVAAAETAYAAAYDLVLIRDEVVYDDESGMFYDPDPTDIATAELIASTTATMARQAATGTWDADVEDVRDDIFAAIINGDVVIDRTATPTRFAGRVGEVTFEGVGWAGGHTDLSNTRVIPRVSGTFTIGGETRTLEDGPFFASQAEAAIVLAD